MNKKMIKYLEKLKKLEKLEHEEILDICTKVMSILIHEPNLPNVTSPVFIVGDIHGQYYDLLNIFKLFGSPKDTKYVFLGDYVDRGYQSIETYLTLLVYKNMYPHNIFLCRGNHEIASTDKDMGFLSEITTWYSQNAELVYSTISTTFRFLNVGALVDGKVLCVHGGLTPKIQTISKIQTIDRFREKMCSGYNDILWSDPVNNPGYGNSSRGAGYHYGPDISKHFLCVNNLDYLIRAHEFKANGYEMHFPDKNVITVWSAPNYIYFHQNVASVLKYTGGAITSDNFLIFRDVHREFNQKINVTAPSCSKSGRIL